jgi:hypothetical protein
MSVRAIWPGASARIQPLSSTSSRRPSSQAPSAPEIQSRDVLNTSQNGIAGE